MIVDDETPNLESLSRILRSDGAEVAAFEDPRTALTELQKRPQDVVITDLRMDTMDGMELLESIKMVDPTIEVILITAYGTVELAVEAMKKGAYDFVTKPLQRLSVLRTVHKALEKRHLVNENQSLKEELKSTGGSRRIVGRSREVREMLEMAKKAGQSRANVLIEGESGTGKGVLAEYIHEHGQNQGVLVKINCTSIPENLLEAELFGYEAGAFTGAVKRKKGRVELSEGGTLFLDEIGIAPPTFQAKLLRFLQEGEFERLGGMETLRVSTRVISATNTDMKAAIKTGQIREDLYYRLNVVNINVPTLRDRAEDVPILAQQFLIDSAKKNGRSAPLLTAETLRCLQAYEWPGNIRELQNLMERLVVLNTTGVVVPEDLPQDVGKADRPMQISVPIGMPIRELEKQVMDETLKYTQGDKKLAAKLLGVHPRTIYRHLESQGRGRTPREPEAAA